MTDYNYEHFPLDLDMSTFEAFPSALKVGQRAPSGTLVKADHGKLIRPSKAWRSGPAVLEFGSIT